MQYLNVSSSQASATLLFLNKMTDLLFAPIVTDRLLSVVLECNTEHQDPSRVTNQEDSEMGAISQINTDA